MRFAWVALLLVTSCHPVDADDPDHDWPPAITPDGGFDDGHCRDDAACGSGLVCARNGECLPTSQVRAVRVTWTLGGSPASNTTCSDAEDLAIEFVADSYDTTGFAPVPCQAGIFSIDKYPTRYTVVRLGPLSYGSGIESALDATGTAALDLPY